MRNSILILILLLTLYGMFYSIYKVFYKDPYANYSDSCKNIFSIGHKNMTPESGKYFSLNCYSDNYTGLKKLNILRKKIQISSNVDNYYNKFYCFGVNVGSDYNVEDYGLDFVLRNSTIMTIYLTPKHDLIYMNAIVFDFDHKGTLNTNPIMTKEKSQICFTYRDMNILLNRKSLQEFINSVNSMRNKKKYKNCIYELINKEGAIKIIYDNNIDFFKFEIK